MAYSLKRRILNETALYLFLGIIISILTARAYVQFGGNLGFGYDGIIFHHIFIGIILVIVSGFVLFAFYDRIYRNKKAMNLLAFAFGVGTGLITDETNFLISVGQYYNLSNYYSSLNIYVDITFIALAFVLFILALFKRKSR